MNYVLSFQAPCECAGTKTSTVRDIVLMTMYVRTTYTTLHRPKPLLILLSLSFSLPAVDPHSQPATQILASFGTIMRIGLKVVPINN